MRADYVEFETVELCQESVEGVLVESDTGVSI